MENILNILFPTKCLFCKQSFELFCSSCLEKCRIIEKDYCLVCDKFTYTGYTHQGCLSKITPLSCFSCFSYSGVTRKCLKISKFGSKQFSALKILINLGIVHTRACGRDYSGLLVMPIPISKDRYKSRGFNQAMLIATALSREYRLLLDSRALVRCVSTDYQFTKNREERYRSLKGIFSADASRVIGKKILLVDDLTTSGATLLEASKALYDAGATEVHCYTLCKREKMI